jgi:FkbM family methyltransferase
LNEKRLRKVIDFFIALYLLPLRLSTRLALYVKGKILTHDEHYLVALDVIKRKFPAHRGVIVDIGAHDADSTVYLGKHLPDNKVLGFEINPVPFAQGKANIKSFSNIELYNIGFADKTGNVDLYVTTNSVSSSLYQITDKSEIAFEKSIKVNVTTLDTFFAGYESILLIKLDVQGAELNILKYGTETLKKTKLVLTEVWSSSMYDGACMYYEVDEILRANNFALHTIITNYNNDGVKYFDILYIKTV